MPLESESIIFLIKIGKDGMVAVTPDGNALDYDRCRDVTEEDIFNALDSYVAKDGLTITKAVRVATVEFKLAPEKGAP